MVFVCVEQFSLSIEVHAGTIWQLTNNLQTVKRKHNRYDKTKHYTNEKSLGTHKNIVQLKQQQ